MASATTKNGPVTHTAKSSRLLELAATYAPPGPYALPNGVVVVPPTRTRRKAMHAAELKQYLYGQQLAQALRAASEPPPATPKTTGDTDADRLAMAAHAAETVEWTKRLEHIEAHTHTINTRTATAIDDYERAFFGDAYDAVMEYFEDKPEEWWQAFVEDIKAEFLPAAPDDGTCKTCGQVIDEEAAGKVPASST